MNNKFSVGFVFLITNYFLFVCFLIWVVNPMWYEELNYTETLNKSDLPIEYRWSEKQEIMHKDYMKKVKGE